MARILRFGVFELDLDRAELRKQGLRLRLKEQPFRVLAALLENQGEVVTRDELVRRLWADGTVVDFDRGLNAAVTRLRQVLADSAETPRYVETVARRGYRFVAPVETVDGATFAATNGRALDSGIAPSLSRPRARKNWRIAVMSAATILLIVVFLVFFRTEREASLEQITRDPGLATDPTLSPDGKLLAYASDRGRQNLTIWVKQLVSGGKAVQLTHDDSDAHQPSFSPDGSTIVYRSERDGGGIFVIPTIGGEPMRIAPGGRNPRFSPNGKWIAYWVGRVKDSAPEANGLGIVLVIPASGGEPKRVGPDLPYGGFPVWSADSKELLVYANPREGPILVEADWWTVPVEGGAARKTGVFARLQAEGFLRDFAAGLPRASDWVDNTLTFSAQKGDTRSVWRMPFSGHGSGSGAAERLTQGTTLDVYPSAGQGCLVFASLRQGKAIWSLPVDANQGKVTGELRRVTDGSRLEVNTSISADGLMLVYGSTVSNQEDIWLKDLHTEKETAIAGTSSIESHPRISRDGSMIAYTVDDTGFHPVKAVPTAVGMPRQWALASGWLFDWTPDKQYVLFHSKSSDPGIKRVSLESGVVDDYLAKSGVSLYQTKFSPDGEWLAFEGVFGGPSGDSRLFIVKTQDGSPAPGYDWILVSDEHGWSDKPRWSPDGNTLYFISDRDGFLCLWAVRLDPATKRPISAPFPIYHFHTSRLSMRNIGLGFLEIDVAKDKIVMALGELTGNIWRLSRR